MPTRPHSALLPAAKQLSKTGRALAALQVVKEILTIILLGVPLLWAQPVLVPAALPGLVLFLYHVGMVRGQVPRRVAATVWVLTLLDEAGGLALYLNVVDAPTTQQLRYLQWSCGLGLAFTLAALLEIWWQRSGERRHLRAQLRAA